MHCREFRKKHLAYLDHALRGEDVAAMQSHLAGCERCSHHDTAVRRGLLVFRNLAPIEPSADFCSRLDARLRKARCDSGELAATRHRGHGAGALIAAAAGVVMVGYATTAILSPPERPREMALAPVVASAPALPATTDASHTVAAAASMGVPVWPVALMAEQAPVRLLDAAFPGFSVLPTAARAP